MKILVASDSFKGSLSSIEVCLAIKEGAQRACPDCEVITLPIADGGEGTLEALNFATGGKIVTVECTNPIGRKIKAEYSILGDGKTAVIEMAKAAGLYLISKEERNPYYTTTYGVGEIILDALDKGCRNFIVGIGGSATVDGGIGMLQALGFEFLNKEGKEIQRGGLDIANLHKINTLGKDSRLEDCTFRIACDVDNTLCGLRGASRVFGPQKGATPEMVEVLEKNLLRFKDTIKTDLGIDISDIKGGGAAGGIGASFVAFLNAQLISGVELVLKSLNFLSQLEGVDLVITGEGQMDEQTSYGKVPMGVASYAKNKSIPVVAIVGSIGEGTQKLYPLGITSIFSILNKPMTLDEAMVDARELVIQTSESVIRLFKINKL